MNCKTDGAGRRIKSIGRFTIGYGKNEITFQLPDSIPVEEITYLRQPADGETVSEEERIRRALRHPIGTRPLKDLAKGKRRAVILISDATRLSPSYKLLPPLLDELREAGLGDGQIRIVVALGMHRKQSEKELEELVGSDVYLRFPVLNHSPLAEDCVHFGTTSAGTPIEIFREAAEADLRIVTGNIEPHRLAGMSGGVKALVPGVASARAIEHNHALSAKFKAIPGNTENPLHRDLREFLEKVPVHFLLNVIADHRRTVLDAVAGDVLEAHRAGAEMAKQRFIVPVDKTYDLVIASAGGHPKDMQLYQAVKTLQNAAEITRPGGRILLVARCEEMFGNGIFQYWIETVQDRERIAEKLRRRFVLGAHKIGHIARILERHNVYLYSQIPAPVVELVGFVPVGDLQRGIDALMEPRPERIGILPFGAITFPQGPPSQVLP